MGKNMQPGYKKQVFYPDKTLRGFIEWYAVLTPSMQDLGSIPWHIMPDGAAHILLHVYTGNDPSAFHNRLVFVGPRSTYIFTNRKRRMLSLIARLKPGIPFLPLTHGLCELKDTSIDLEDGLSLDLVQEREELMLLASSLQIDRLIKRFDLLMLDILQANLPASHLVQVAIQQIHRSGGGLSMKALSSALGVSDRHLRSLFKREVGLSPKRYSRILRLTETIRTVDRGYNEGHAQLALSSGYYDQSHMIEEFQALVGESTDAFVTRTNREDVLFSSSVFSNTLTGSV